jgi:transposase
MVSQDDGVPLVSKAWDGHASDRQVFPERAEALLSTFEHSPPPRYLVADSKLYSAENAKPLAQLGWITRIPSTLKLVSQVIRQALRADTWQAVDARNRYHCLDRYHDGMVQRWFVVCSEAATEQAEKSVSKDQKREFEAIDQPLFHLQAKRFESQPSAQAAWTARSGSWRYHPVATTEFIEHKRYAGTGRPSAKVSIAAIEWQICAEVCPDAETIRRHTQPKGCLVLGTNIEVDDLGDEEVIAAYKA